MADGPGGSGEGPPPEEEGPLEPGLAGFAVDPALGFVAVLAEGYGDGGDGDGDGNGAGAAFRRWTYAVASPTDRERVGSAEALTLVQLAGGIDVGAAVLPPGALLAAVRDELGDEEDGEDAGDGPVVAARLVGIRAVPGGEPGPGPGPGRGGQGQPPQPFPSPPPSSAERDGRIASDAPRLLESIRNLPGLAGVTTAAVGDAMLLHADEAGGVGREEFAAVLAELRSGKAGTAGGGSRGVPPGAAFELRAETRREGGAVGPVVRWRATGGFQALGLALRYRVPIEVDGDCFEGGGGRDGGGTTTTTEPVAAHGTGTAELLERFPAFRSRRTLREDAEPDALSAGLFYKKEAPGFE